MSELREPESRELRIVTAIGREFDRVIEREPARGRRPLRIPARLVVAGLVAVITLTLLTAPGREAAAWVGELVGIGEVGGPPSENKRGFEDPSSPNGPIVIDNGRAPDGTRYEWVAYRCEVDLPAEGQPGHAVRGLGLNLEWPTVKGHDGGGSCEGQRGKHERIPLIGGFGAQIVPSQFKAGARPDVVVSGTVGAKAARRVRVVYRDARGEDHDLPVDFGRVDGGLRKRAGRAAPAATFVAFVDGKQAARDRLEDCLDLRAVETVAGQHPIERCAELHPEVRAFRARLARCGAGVGRGVLDKRIAGCVGRPPPSPLRAIVYDANGRRLGEQGHPINIPVPVAAPAAGTPEYRGRGNGRRGRLFLIPGAAGTPVVLASGSTPDGVPYEYLAQKLERRNGEVYSVCLTRWFPYVRGIGGSGNCGRGFPPTKAYGKPWPRKVVARPFGILVDGEPATAYLALEGFARANVARVRVVHKDGRGGWRDAPVKFVRVRGGLRKRVGSAESFGFFVAFLPPSIKRYYPRPGARADGPPALEVIAYDDGGRKIGRFKHRN